MHVWNGLLDLIYPPRCLTCGAWQSNPALCDECIRDVKPLLSPFCERCGISIAPDRLRCEPCRTGEEPPYAWSQAAGRYEGRLLDAIHRLKYDGKTALARPLGSLLARSLDAPPSPLLTPAADGPSFAFEVVVPVPLHPARLRQRGFNQAERLARVVAEARGWPLDAHGLKRIRATPSQTTRENREARLSNVAGAFAAASPMRFAGKSVLIVDDVLTTMATTRECARVAQEAGAIRIGIVALAHG